MNQSEGSRVWGVGISSKYPSEVLGRLGCWVAYCFPRQSCFYVRRVKDVDKDLLEGNWLYPVPSVALNHSLNLSGPTSLVKQGVGLDNIFPALKKIFQSR